MKKTRQTKRKFTFGKTAFHTRIFGIELCSSRGITYKLCESVATVRRISIDDDAMFAVQNVLINLPECQIWLPTLWFSFFSITCNEANKNFVLMCCGLVGSTSSPST